MQHRIGQYLRLELIYHSQWLQISEIMFNYGPLMPNTAANIDMNNMNSREHLMKLFEWTQSNQYNNNRHVDGTRYVMPEDNALYNNHTSSTDNNQFSLGHNRTANQTVKYSLMIVCLCTLGKICI